MTDARIDAGGGVVGVNLSAAGVRRQSLTMPSFQATSPTRMKFDDRDVVEDSAGRDFQDIHGADVGHAVDSW